MQATFTVKKNESTQKIVQFLFAVTFSNKKPHSWKRCKNYRYLKKKAVKAVYFSTNKKVKTSVSSKAVRVLKIRKI